MPLGFRGDSAWRPSNVHRYNGWLPSSRVVHKAFLGDVLARATGLLNQHAQHTPSVQKFKTSIEANAIMIDLFNNVLLQAPSENQVTSFELLLYAFDIVFSGPPAVLKVPGEPAEPVGVPIYILMDYLMNSSAAYTLFTMDEFNAAMKTLLNSWGEYLVTPDSNSTLTDQSDGWFSDEALTLLESDDRGVFNETYITPNRDAVNRGYASWDAFFVRDYQPKARPIVPAPPGTVVYNACESTVERYKSKVKLHDRFWLKGMAYSFYDMLGGDEALAARFIGGTVYQASLTPKDYHRWRAPVAGKIVETRVIQGTYYAVLPDEGDDSDTDSDDGHRRDMRGALVRCLPWLTVVATRALIIIDAGEKSGLVGFMAIGMVEVSTCEITVKKGDLVQPGDELGMFHFGGSSYAMLFGPHMKLAFRNTVKPGVHQKVNTILADVKLKTGSTLCV